MFNDTLSPQLEENLNIITDSFRQQFLTFQKKKTVSMLARHAREEDAQAAVQHDAFLDLSPLDVRRYSVIRAINQRVSAAMKGQPARGFEHDCHLALLKRRDPAADPLTAGTILIPADVARRSLHVTPGSKGGFLTATAELSFSDLLRANSTIFKLGAAHVTDQVGNVLIARQTAGATTTWLGPAGAAAAESEPGLGQYSASPKTVMTFTQKSVQLSRQLDPAAEFFLLSGFAKDLAVAVDAAVIQGTGGVQPLGVLNTPGIQSQSGTTLNAGCATMKSRSAEANAIDDRISFLSTPAVRALLEGREKTTGGGNFVWQKDSVADRQAAVSTNVPAATMICGDWSNVVVIEWGSLAIEVNPFLDLNRGLMGIRSMWLVDTIVTSPASFVVATSIT